MCGLGGEHEVGTSGGEGGGACSGEGGGERGACAWAGEAISRVRTEERGRGEDAEDEAHGHEVSQDEPLVLVRGRGAAVKRKGELSLGACELRVEQREAADEIVVGDELIEWERAARDDLAIERLGEALPLHRTDQVLAQPKVVQLEVDFKEIVDHVQRAPLLTGLNRRAVGDDEAERLLEDARRLLQPARLLALLLELHVRALCRTPQRKVKQVQRRHRPVSVLLEGGLEGTDGALDMRVRFHVLPARRRAHALEAFQHHLIVWLLQG